MYSSDKSKYKDELPKNTVYKIKNILNNLGLVPIEASWKNSAEGFYSLSVSIKDTDLSTNGKGTTPEYALASAYGELMERLQNQTFFRLSKDMSPEAFKYKGFYYAPDEKYLTKEDFINSQEDWIKIQKDNMNSNINLTELLEKWQSISYEDIPSDFVALPYINLNTNKLSYIPIKMISKMYMSNGMCAGNSVEEALVQGLSEIFERVANKEIILSKITPPTIPYNYILRYPRIQSMIEKIESSGDYKVIVKDCSLGKGYPVVGVIFINNIDQSYIVKFGSHPMFEIALERTLTELLQGQDVKNMMGLKEFCYKNYSTNEYDNLIGILVNGSGYYPTELFSKNFSYDFKPFKVLNGSPNKEILTYLITLLAKNGHDVFIRDVSYMGFPSFHVIVPEFSEVDAFDDIKSIDDYSNYVKIKKYIRNLNKLSPKEIAYLMEYLNTINISGEVQLSQLINLNIKTSLPWYCNNMDLFKAAAYYKIGNYVNSYKNFDNFFKYTQPNYFNKKIYTYYKCVRDYIGTRIDTPDEQTNIEILNTFYSHNIIKKVISQFKDNTNIFNIFAYLNCWDCKNCSVKNSCSYFEIEKVYKILKKTNALNPTNQMWMQNLLK